MEKALQSIAKLKAKLVSDEELLRAAWKSAVGPRIEAHARIRALFGKRLVVEVDDRVWQSQLESLAPAILAKLEKLTGGRLAAFLDFRVGLPRRMPEAVEAPFSLTAQDAEAAKIRDPYLRRIYLQSKRRAKSS
jgi:hypothetical protein